MAEHLNEDCLIGPIILNQDETFVDGNGRRTLTPMYMTLGMIHAGARNHEWARALIGYITKPKKTTKPRDCSMEEWKRYKRRVYRKSMRVMLAPIRKFTESGVRMHLQGRDGKLKWMTVIPVIAFGSYDHPEMKKVTGIKDYYRKNPMLCSMYVHLAQ